jgi:hypothetical protein
MKAKIGTVIHGTLRNEDLIPTFAEVLASIDEEKIFQDIIKEALAFSNWEDIDEAIDISEDLFIGLNYYAPRGCYFGCTDGDGSDFGFWKSMEF